MSASLLDVTDLRVAFATSDGVVQAVRGVSFAVEPGETLGIVGESGSGKSVCTQALLDLTPGADVSGRAWFDGADLLSLPPDGLRRIRGPEIAMIFQDPLTSLHPLYKVGWQIAELIREHTDTARKQAWARAVELLDLVGIPSPAERVTDYPHQFSGGMRQRVMIAMALALEPRLIIADEPTTALDATVQAQVIDLMKRLQAELETALILITHDLGLVADVADRVLVMYAGKAVETAGRRTVYYRPHHPYTTGLLGSIPGARGASRTAAATAEYGDRIHGVGGGLSAKPRLRPIPGQPPSLIAMPSGCPFHPRCSSAMERCRSEEPPLLDVGPAHESACWLPADQPGPHGSPDPADGREHGEAP